MPTRVSNFQPGLGVIFREQMNWSVIFWRETAKQDGGQPQQRSYQYKCGRKTEESYCFGFGGFAFTFNCYSNVWRDVSIPYPTAAANCSCPKHGHVGYYEKYLNDKAAKEKKNTKTTSPLGESW